MYINDKYYFLISISKDAYKNKLETKAAVGDKDLQPLREQLGIERICYYRIPLTIEGLLQKVLHGYTFCALFSDFRENSYSEVLTIYNGTYFTAQGKAGEFFEGSYFIGVDIDETQYQKTEDMLNKLSLIPSLWYTSFSHMEMDKGKCKGLRLRLIYVFDNMITDKYFFRYCSSNLHKIIEYDLDEEVYDKCGLNCTQYFNGTNINDNTITVEYGISNTVYSLSDIGVSNEEYYNYLYNYCGYKSLAPEIKAEIDNRLRILLPHSNIINSPPPQFVLECKESIQSTDVHNTYVSNELVSALSLLPWTEFYMKYKHKYPYIYRKENEIWEKLGDVEYQWCDDSYFELPWIPRKITDGNHRRHSLFHRAWMRRIIMPDITPDVLFFNLAVDRLRFYDNSDNQLTTAVLVTKVKEGLKDDVELLIERYKDVYNRAITTCRQKKFIVRKKNGEKVDTNKLKKELLWTLLDRLYDNSLTLSENNRMMSEEGLVISEDSLRRYCKDRGIKVLTPAEKRYRKFTELHICGLSLRKELEMLKQHGLKLQLHTLQKYRVRYQQEQLTSPKVS